MSKVQVQKNFDNMTTPSCYFMIDINYKVQEPIAFRLAVLVYRYQHDIGPLYLTADLHRVVDVKFCRRAQSASTTAPIVSHTAHQKISDRAFPVTAVRIWNHFQCL